MIVYASNLASPCLKTVFSFHPLYIKCSKSIALKLTECLLGLDCRWHLGRQTWWESCTRFWSCLVVNRNSFNSYCCKTWAAMSAYYACLYGNWRGWFILFLYYIYDSIYLVPVIVLTRPLVHIFLLTQNELPVLLGISEIAFITLANKQGEKLGRLTCEHI